MPIARAAEDLLWKWDAPLVPGDSTTVGEGDACVSMQNGMVLGVFQPGVHRLPGAIPDGVELWFCATRPIQGTKVGGRSRTGANVFGDFGFQVVAPHLLAQNVASIGAPGDLVRYLTHLVQKEVMFALDAAVAPEALAGTVEARLAPRWEPIGVRFIGFGMLNVR